VHYRKWMTAGFAALPVGGTGMKPRPRFTAAVIVYRIDFLLAHLGDFQQRVQVSGSLHRCQSG
jgi:hypothetical protein